ncbi:MAG: protein-disulfide reductase DsbD N-terminal domain-containing protein [Candidatus Bipolaricaulota bacterium]|nr:protein-disulfide reductase DsbD N-terminal domain-containing protein [Candidatus Bipolaricaulota bacterium]
MRRLLGLALGVAAFLAQAQPGEEGVAIRAWAAGRPGSAVALVVALEIPEGWALQAHQPSLPHLIPTVLAVEPAADVQVEEIRYPEAQEKYLAFAKRALAVYTGTTAIVVVLRIAEGAAPGLRLLPARLRFQLCTATYCLLPEEREFLLGVWVLP